jgi:hypothetical protein
VRAPLTRRRAAHARSVGLLRDRLARERRAARPARRGGPDRPLRQPGALLGPAPLERSRLHLGRVRAGGGLHGHLRRGGRCRVATWLGAGGTGHCARHRRGRDRRVPEAARRVRVHRRSDRPGRDRALRLGRARRSGAPCRRGGSARGARRGQAGRLRDRRARRARRRERRPNRSGCGGGRRRGDGARARAVGGRRTDRRCRGNRLPRGRDARERTVRLERVAGPAHCRRNLLLKLDEICGPRGPRGDVIS